MCHLFIRLLVALLTFAVGVALSALWGLFGSAPAKKAETLTLVAAPRLVQVPSADYGVRVEAPIEAGILNSKAISKPPAVYPPIARAARATGTVVVRVVLDEVGRVEVAEAVSGHPLLQQAAVAAAREARFSPTRLSGRPVRVAGKLTYEFTRD